MLGHLAGPRSLASFKGLRSSSRQATAAAKGSSRKSGNQCELVLQRALLSQACPFLSNVTELIGCPDLAFPESKLVVFCDGDFWHGRHWDERRNKLLRGANSTYWVAKITANITRDWRVTRAYLDAGWTVLRFWESDLRADPHRVARHILSALGERSDPQARNLDSSELHGVNRA